jgi:tetratricopeptide (TPR) repeat protein
VIKVNLLQFKKLLSNILNKFFYPNLQEEIQIWLFIAISIILIGLLGWLVFSIFHLRSIENVLGHLLKKGEFQEVINLASEFLQKKKKKKRKEMVLVLYYLAKAYENTKSFSNALKFYDEVLLLHSRQDKFYINVLLNIAKVYEKLGKVKESMAYYLMALDRDENNIEALYAMGKIHYSNGNVKRSLDYFEKLLQKKPSILDARKYYGKALMDCGFFLPALTQFEFLVRYYPEDFEVYYLKGKAEENLKNYIEAIKTYKQLLKREFYEEKTLEKVLNRTLFQIREELKVCIVRLYIKLKKYEESLTTISEYLSLPGEDETKLELLYLYGNVLWNTGEEYQALKNYERIYMMKPDFKDVSLFYERYKKILPHSYLGFYFTMKEEEGKNFDFTCRKILGKQNFNIVYKNRDYAIYSKGPFAVVFYRHIEPIPFSQLTDIEVILNGLPVMITNVEIYSISGVREDAYTHFLLKKSNLIEGDEFIKIIRSIY